MNLPIHGAAARVSKFHNIPYATGRYTVVGLRSSELATRSGEAGPTGPDAQRPWRACTPPRLMDPCQVVPLCVADP